MKFAEQARDIAFDFPRLAEDTIDSLGDQHARAKTNYEAWKRNPMEWLQSSGRTPIGYEGTRNIRSDIRTTRLV